MMAGAWLHRADEILSIGGQEATLVAGEGLLAQPVEVGRAIAKSSGFRGRRHPEDDLPVGGAHHGEASAADDADRRLALLG